MFAEQHAENVCASLLGTPCDTHLNVRGLDQLLTWFVRRRCRDSAVVVPV